MNDEAAMSLALAEAVKALGRTHPNPAVGAVIVKKGKVIATGYTAPAGGPHAEAMALARAGTRAKGATIYATLEPCNHHGRTPPCTEAIIAAGIKRVVFGAVDPNPKVDGKGARRLTAAGLDVRGLVLAEAAAALNAPFFKAIRTGLPWVTAKAGITLDGKLATSTGRSKWITSEASRQVAHQLRNLVDAIIVGASTVDLDNPQLTTRLATGVGRSPMRVVIDPSLRVSPRATIFSTVAAKTVVATLRSPEVARAKALTRRGVEVWTFPGTRGRIDVRALLERLVQVGALHVLVEGGAGVHSTFLQSGLIDELVLFVAPSLFGHEGLTWSGALGIKDPARAPRFEFVDAVRVGSDVMLRARATKSPKSASRR